MGGKGAAVEILAIQDRLGDELLFDALQPLALDGRPVPHGIDAGHGLSDPLFMADQRIAQGLTADKGDDVGGNVFIFPVLPGDLQVLFGEAGLIEGQLQFLEGLSGQFPGALAHDGQGGDLVHVGDDEFPEGVEIVFRFFGIAVAAGVGCKLVFVVGDELLFRAMAVFVQEGQEVAPGGELLAACLRIVLPSRMR